MSESAPSKAAPSWFARIAILAIAVPLPFLVHGRVAAAPEIMSLCAAAADGTRAALLRATGIPDDELAALRARFPEDGLLVVFYDLAPLPVDAKAQLSPMLESRSQLYRNLLYPHPRDVRMARDTGELGRLVQLPHPGALVVVDLRQEDSGPPSVGDFELGFERKAGVRVRHWLLRGVPK